MPNALTHTPRDGGTIVAGHRFGGNGTMSHTPPYELQGKTICKRPVHKENSDGTHSVEMGLPVCEVFEWLMEPQMLVNILNNHDRLVEALRDMTSRFEKCLVINGTDKEYALIATETARTILAEIDQ